MNTQTAMNKRPSPAEILALSRIILTYTQLHARGVTGLELARAFPTFTDENLDASLRMLVTVPCIRKEHSSPPEPKQPNFDFLGNVRPPSPWISRYYRQEMEAIPQWDRAKHLLEFRGEQWEFHSGAHNVVAVLNALEGNSWKPVEVVPKWVPVKDQVFGRNPNTNNEKALNVFQVRDALTVLKTKTSPPIEWHQKGLGVWWEMSN